LSDIFALKNVKLDERRKINNLPPLIFRMPVI